MEDKTFHQQMPMEEVEIDGVSCWVLHIPIRYTEWLKQFEMEPGNVDLEFSLSTKAPLIARPKSQRYTGDPFKWEEHLEMIEKLKA